MQVGIPVACNVCEVKLDTVNNWICLQREVGNCSESKERFAIQRYLLIIGKKQNMQVLSHTFTHFST